MEGRQRIYASKRMERRLHETETEYPFLGYSGSLDVVGRQGLSVFSKFGNFWGVYEGNQ